MRRTASETSETSNYCLKLPTLMSLHESAIPEISLNGETILKASFSDAEVYSPLMLPKPPIPADEDPFVRSLAKCLLEKEAEMADLYEQNDALYIRLNELKRRNHGVVLNIKDQVMKNKMLTEEQNELKRQLFKLESEFYYKNQASGLPANKVKTLSLVSMPEVPSILVARTPVKPKARPYSSCVTGQASFVRSSFKQVVSEKITEIDALKKMNRKLKMELVDQGEVGARTLQREWVNQLSINTALTNANRELTWKITQLKKEMNPSGKDASVRRTSVSSEVRGNSFVRQRSESSNIRRNSLFCNPLEKNREVWITPPRTVTPPRAPRYI